MTHAQAVHAGFKAFPKQYTVKHKLRDGWRNTTVGSIIAADKEYFTVNTKTGLDINIMYDNIIYFRETNR